MISALILAISFLQLLFGVLDSFFPLGHWGVLLRFGYKKFLISSQRQSVLWTFLISLCTRNLGIFHWILEIIFSCISSPIQRLLSRELLSFHECIEHFLVFLLLLKLSFNPWWFDKLQGIISMRNTSHLKFSFYLSFSFYFFLHLLRPGYMINFEKDPWGTEKVYIFVFGWNIS